MPFSAGDRLGRYEILSLLGAGGFGVVYEALDPNHGEKVALKTLRAPDPDHVFRFKREFRSLTDLRHPNLVSLYELAFEADHWFFAMELVEGVDFISYVRSGAGLPAGHAERPAGSSSLRELETLDLPDPLAALTCDSLFDEARLRASLMQLAEGVMALHKASKVHGDLKPANVLVTPEGRVVLLDFGLVKEIQAENFDCETLGTELAGTPLYMSPEQSERKTVTEASDWYSVGVILYQALTGRPPFSGSDLLELVQRKLSTAPPTPSELVAGVPKRLEDLCMDLLEVPADKRPSGKEILGKLAVSAGAAPAEPESRQGASNRDTVFVGRGTHLEALEKAYWKSRNEKAVVMYIHGRSGMGKTRLALRFLENLRAREPTVVLKGRCYQQESVPYKAFDGVMDALTRYLRRLPDREAALLAPRNVRDLVRLFPVLGRVEVLAEASRRGPVVPNPQEAKRRAFAALKELFARLGDRQGLIVFIDDLQWGDLDSALLLRDLVWGDDQPSMFIVGCYRSEEADSSPMLKDLLSRESLADSEHRNLEVGELSVPETLHLAELLLSGKEENDSLKHAVATESGGVPFLVAELARFMETEKELSTGTQGELVMLDELIRWRASQLPNQARRLLEVVAVAVRPTPVSVCMRAAALESGELESLALLRSEHLVRVHQVVGEEEVATYHDRIRESVVAALDEETLSSCHLLLGESLESMPEADPELLMGHFLEGGRYGKAESYALRAADLAFASLAFDRAARLYGFALDMGGKDDSENQDLLLKLGDSLANAYRGPEAAKVYLRATSGQDPETVLELRHRAAYQFLATGHMEEGIRVAREVLKSVGMRLPAYHWLDIVRLLLRRAWVRIRGVRYHERSSDSLDPKALLRVDACFTVGMSMAIADPLVGMLDFSTRHTILALRTGEASRVSLALSAEGAALAYLGQYRRAGRIVNEGREVARRIEDPFALGMAEFSSGIAEYWAAGNWKNADARFMQAVEIFTSRCTGVSIWLSFARGFGLLNLYYLGRMRELSRKHPILLKDARERRDLSAEFLIGESESHNVFYLAADEVERAREEVKAVFVPTGRENPFFNWHGLAHNVDRELYAGNFHDIRKNLSSLWSAVSHSQAFRIPLTQSLSLLVYGRGLVGAALSADGRERADLLKLAERSARRLKRLPMSFSRPGSEIIRAGAATQSGDASAALSLVTAAVHGFEAADMSLHAAVCRRRRGELLGGDEGKALIQQANSKMAGECIKNPDRWANMIAPGKWTGNRT